MDLLRMCVSVCCVRVSLHTTLSTPPPPTLVTTFIPDQPKILSSTNSVAFVYLFFYIPFCVGFFFHSDFIFAFIHFACTIPLFHFEFQTFFPFISLSFTLCECVSDYVFVSIYGITHTHTHMYTYNSELHIAYQAKQ